MARLWHRYAAALLCALAFAGAGALSAHPFALVELTGILSVTLATLAVSALAALVIGRSAATRRPTLARVRARAAYDSGMQQGWPAHPDRPGRADRPRAPGDCARS